MSEPQPHPSPRPGEAGRAASRSRAGPPKIGILAIQGDIEAHAKAVERLGAAACPVRRGKELDDLDALILPGGESTTIAKGLERLGLYQPLEAFAAAGRPVLGTCAGAVLLARSVENHPVRPLGLLDIVAVRNAYGTQVNSFASVVDPAVEGLEGLRCIFIRAPRLRRPGGEVEVLARLEGWPVCVRQGKVLATTFHPELGDDPRIHALLLEML